MRALAVLALLISCGCGFQHLRFEADSAGFDDLFYLMEPTLKLYDLDGAEAGERQQYAPFALVYTGPLGRVVTIHSRLLEFEKGDTKLQPVQFGHCIWSAAEETADDGPAQRIFGAAAGDCGEDLILRIGVDATDMTQYLQLRTPKEGGLRNGRWYRLALDVVAADDKGVAELRSKLEYDFYVSQSESLLGFAVGTGLVLGFSLLGL